MPGPWARDQFLKRELKIIQGYTMQDKVSECKCIHLQLF